MKFVEYFFATGKSVMRDVDTITAIATAPGESALAIVRVSGREAIAVADAVFRGRIPLSRAAGFTVHYGRRREPRGGNCR